MNFEKVKQHNNSYRFVRSWQSGQENTPGPIFYVGDRMQFLQNVSEKLGAGYFSVVSLSQARAYLKKLHSDNVQVGAILLDLAIERDAFSKFSHFLLNTRYASVPVMLVSSKITLAERAFLAEEMVVDDVIHPMRDIFTLGERIRFVRKVKEGISSLPVHVNPRNRDWSGLLKRALDVLVSGSLLFLLSPVLLLIALAIKLDSRGPLFYNCYRVGKGYRVFKLFRFRTMKVGADRLVTSLSHLNRFGRDSFQSWKDSDPRVTHTGRFMRKTGLDKLPQLYNVLRGDMSIVGNKPLPLYEASSFTTNEAASRFEAPAGMTGLWQIQNKSGDTGCTLTQDLAYAKKGSFWLDIRIMMKAGMQYTGMRRRRRAR